MDDKQLLAEIRLALEAYRMNCADPTKAKPIAALGFAMQVEQILREADQPTTRSEGD